MAHKYIETLKARLDSRDAALTDVVKAAQEAGVPEAELVATLRKSLTNDQILSVLYPDASEVQKRLAHAALKEAAKQGLTGPGRGVGAGTFQPVAPETGAELNKARTDREAAANSEVQKRVRELREKRSKPELLP